MSAPSQNQTADTRLFTATLSPYRSLSRRGFNTLMAFLGIVSFTAGIIFLRMGAWPVFGFFGLDVAILYFAFRRNYMDARAFEQIDLSREELHVRRVSALGRETEYSFNPYWTRLIIDRRSWGIAALSLASSGRRLPIGIFLGPSERASFADALSSALAAARSAPAPG
jgi:uncharacterized membrane protein